MFLALLFLINLSGDKVLQNVEKAMTLPLDMGSTMKMVLVESNGTERQRTMKTWTKDKNKRLMKFLEPADVKGVGFLILSDEEMYIYMPAFGKIRRIASHTKHQSFMGSDFSYEDIGEIEYTKKYDAKIIDESEKSYTLELSPKPKSNLEYSKTIMYVDRETFLPDSSKLFDKGGNLYKIMRIVDVGKIKDYWITKKLTMENVKNGHKTLLEMVDIKVDIGITDEIFTKRNLKRAK